MSENVIFEVPGDPKGKARARTVRQNGKTRTYTPTETVMYENLVKMCYQQSGECHYFEGAITMRIDAFYSIPKSASKKKHDAMIAGEIRPTKKPDSDNVIKSIADALNGIAYKDDSQIVSVHFEKWYAEQARVKVTLHRYN